MYQTTGNDFNFVVASTNEVLKGEQEMCDTCNNDRVCVPATGPESVYGFDQAPYGHIDRAEQVRRVVELGLRYAYEYNRADANLLLDRNNAESQQAILRNNRMKVAELTGGK